MGPVFLKGPVVDGAGPSPPGGAGRGSWAPECPQRLPSVSERQSGRGDEAEGLHGVAASISPANTSLGREPGALLGGSPGGVWTWALQEVPRPQLDPVTCRAGPTRGLQSSWAQEACPAIQAPSAGAPGAAGQWTQELHEQSTRLLFTNKAVARGDVHVRTKVRAPLENADGQQTAGRDGHAARGRLSPAVCWVELPPGGPPPCPGCPAESARPEGYLP